MSEKLITLLEILNYATDLLKEKHISDARLNAELMLSDALNCKRLDLYLEFDKPLQKHEKEKFKKHLLRRLKYEPVQYIIGRTNFYGYDIEVNKSVLIPRPDTEILAEKLLNDIKTSELNRVSIFEAGTGSGCIAIAVCKELEKMDVDYRYKGIDVSDSAIDLCQKNLELNKVRNIEIKKFDFTVGNALDIFGETKYDYFVSNPPYIPLAEYNELEPEVREYEPKYSLTDNADGLTFYKRIFEMYNSGETKYFLEIAYNAKTELESLLREYGIEKHKFIKDYCNNDRILILEK